MFNRIRWLEIPEIVYGKSEKIVLRITTGDSNFVNTTGFTYIFTVQEKAWHDKLSSKKPLIEITGVMEDIKEPGRIIFTLTAEQTKLNPTKQYYFQITENSIDNTKHRVIFAGSFSVIKSILFEGDKNECSHS